MEKTVLLRWRGFTLCMGFDVPRMTWTTRWLDAISDQNSRLHSCCSASDLDSTSHGQSDSIRPRSSAFGVENTQLGG